MDKWDRKTNFSCISCMFCVPKRTIDSEDCIGRCRRNAPTLKGYPVISIYNDWCGEHKLGSNPVRDKMPCDKLNVTTKPLNKS